MARRHQVEVRTSAHHVRVESDGKLLAESSRPLLLFETGLPARHYLPREDVVATLDGPTDKRTHCPFKGDAEHYSVGDLENVAWSYPDPIPDVERIAGMICFYDERVDVIVDGELAERPVTPHSH